MKKVILLSLIYIVFIAAMPPVLVVGKTTKAIAIDGTGDSTLMKAPRVVIRATWTYDDLDTTSVPIQLHQYRTLALMYQNHEVATDIPTTPIVYSVTGRIVTKAVIDTFVMNYYKDLGYNATVISQ